MCVYIYIYIYIYIHTHNNKFHRALKTGIFRLEIHKAINDDEYSLMFCLIEFTRNIKILNQPILYTCTLAITPELDTHEGGSSRGERGSPKMITMTIKWFVYEGRHFQPFLLFPQYNTTSGFEVCCISWHSKRSERIFPVQTNTSSGEC